MFPHTQGTKMFKGHYFYDNRETFLAGIVMVSWLTWKLSPAIQGDSKSMFASRQAVRVSS